MPTPGERFREGLGGVLRHMGNNATVNLEGYANMIKQIPGNIKRMATEPKEYFQGALSNVATNMQRPEAALDFAPMGMGMAGSIVPHNLFTSHIPAKQGYRKSPIDQKMEFDVSDYGMEFKDFPNNPVDNNLFFKEHNKLSGPAKSDFQKTHFPVYGGIESAWAAADKLKNVDLKSPNNPLPMMSRFIRHPEFDPTLPELGQARVLPFQATDPFMPGFHQAMPAGQPSVIGIPYSPRLKEFADPSIWQHEGIQHFLDWLMRRTSGRDTSAVDSYKLKDILSYLFEPGETRAFASGMSHMKKDMPPDPYTPFYDRIKTMMDMQSQAGRGIREDVTPEIINFYNDQIANAGVPGHVKARWESAADQSILNRIFKPRKDY